MAKVRGRFYFKLTNAGNLLGEYSNDHSGGHVLPECALRNSQTTGFAGVYTSTWYEPTGAETKVSQLTIGVSGSTFQLEWIDPTTQHMQFKGGGMICDGNLIGDYQSA